MQTADNINTEQRSEVEETWAIFKMEVLILQGTGSGDSPVYFLALWTWTVMSWILGTDQGVGGTEP